MKFIDTTMLMIAGIGSMLDIVQALPSEIIQDIDIVDGSASTQANCSSYQYEVYYTGCAHLIPCSETWTSRLYLEIGPITSSSRSAHIDGTGCLQYREYSPNELSIVYNPRTDINFPLMGQVVEVAGDINPIDNMYFPLEIPQDMVPGATKVAQSTFYGGKGWTCRHDYNITCK
eukprot:Clim_evm1s178 gene=Clim_evmTU1s178